jgi:penicillin-binding protein 2
LASTGARLRPGRFLPPDPRAKTPYRLTPQMVFRIGILGFLALVAFGILFFRLWALQVLSGSQHLQAAENNQHRTLRIEAARGPIRDRKDRVIVDNEGATAIRVYPSDLPDKGAYGELKRLAQILRVPLVDITKQIEKYKGDPVTPVTVKEDATEAEVQFLTERNAEFPGVVVEDTYIRRYPFGDLAPQLLGHIGEISPEQLKEQRGYRSGDRIGQGGIEAAYDKFLRGQTGFAQLRVDSLGRPTSPAVRDADPIPGHGLLLTLDAKLQRAAQAALVEGIELARADPKNWNANAGAIIALDPKDGAIRAMASFPTFDPEVFVKPGKRRELQQLLDPKLAAQTNYPALNRVTSGLYPPGSTFKPVTALAAMQERILAPYDSIQCTGEVTIYKQRFRNWNPFVDEPMTLPTALAESCDTYFYEVGKRFYALPPERGQPLQRWATAFGFGKPTGLDAGSEGAGLVPTFKWKKDTFTAEIDRIWKPGDSIQLAIGQKDLQVTPLQMARFYALVANGGKLVTPHVVQAVQQGNARSGPTGPLTLRRFSPPAQEIAIDKAALDVVREGLYQATHATNGTSAGIFGHFPVAIAGKTGTAERSITVGDYTFLMDTSWWCGYGPADKAELVVCAVIENGGFGGEAAAPAALRIFESYFNQEAGLVQPDKAD